MNDTIYLSPNESGICQVVIKGELFEINQAAEVLEKSGFAVNEDGSISPRRNAKADEQRAKKLVAIWDSSPEGQGAGTAEWVRQCVQRPNLHTVGNECTFHVISLKGKRVVSDEEYTCEEFFSHDYRLVAENLLDADWNAGKAPNSITTTLHDAKEGDHDNRNISAPR